MKPIDMIEQLVGSVESCDIVDTASFIFYNCSKLANRTVSVNFDRGLVEVYNKTGDAVETTYAIRATLEPVTNDV